MTELPETLLCTKCKVDKPLDAFAKKASNGHRFGYQNWCRECNKAYQDAYLDNPDRRKAAAERTSQWAKDNPERAKDTQKALYDKRRADPELWAEALAYRREWYAANIEEQRPKKAAYMRERYAKMSPAQKHREANRTHLRRKGVVTVPFTDEAFLDKWAYWNNCCWICGTDQRLETDHLKPIDVGGWNVVSNFRPICRSCNPAKSGRWPFPMDPAEARKAIGVEWVGPSLMDQGIPEVVRRDDGVPIVKFFDSQGEQVG